MSVGLKVTIDKKAFDKALRTLGRPELIRREVLKPALNDSLKKGRVLVRKAIQKRYTFPPALLRDERRGVSAHFATTDRLSGYIFASNLPVGLSNMKVTYKGSVVARQVSFDKKKGKMKRGRNIKRSRTGTDIMAEIKAGDKKVVAHAFAPGIFSYKKGIYTYQGATPAIFRRGKYIKGGGFMGMKGGRYPISALNTTSIGTAAKNIDTAEIYQDEMNAYTNKRFQHYVKRTLAKITKA